MTYNIQYFVYLFLKHHHLLRVLENTDGKHNLVTFVSQNCKVLLDVKYLLYLEYVKLPRYTKNN